MLELCVSCVFNLVINIKHFFFKNINTFLVLVQEGNLLLLKLSAAESMQHSHSSFLLKFLRCQCSSAGVASLYPAGELDCWRSPQDKGTFVSNWNGPTQTYTNNTIGSARSMNTIGTSF